MRPHLRGARAAERNPGVRQHNTMERIIPRILSCPPYRWYFGRRVIPSKILVRSLCSLWGVPSKTESVKAMITLGRA